MEKWRKTDKIWQVALVILFLLAMLVPAAPEINQDLWVKADPRYQMVSVMPENTEIKIEYAGQYGDSIFVIFNKDEEDFNLCSLSCYAGVKGQYLEKKKIKKLEKSSLVDPNQGVKIFLENDAEFFFPEEGYSLYNGEKINLWENMHN